MIALTGQDARFRQRRAFTSMLAGPAPTTMRSSTDPATGTLVPVAATQPERGRFGRRRTRADRRGAAVRWSVAVLTRIKGGHVIDPANGRDGVADIWIRDGRIIEASRRHPCR